MLARFGVHASRHDPPRRPCADPARAPPREIIVASDGITGGLLSCGLKVVYKPQGNGNGWEDAPEIYDFANNVIGGGPALPKVERPEPSAPGGVVRTKYTGEFSEAWVYFTTGGGLMKDRK